MKRVIVISPFRASDYYTEEQHRLYLRHCLADCVARGESPFAGHSFLPDVLDDSDSAERAKGMLAGWAWFDVADKAVVYGDFGVSRGMMDDIRRANEIGLPVEQPNRTLPQTLAMSIKNIPE